jgi:hypothetical protein
MIKAKHGRLLAALIAKLPAETAGWPRAGRVAWLRMMAMAFDVAYGPCGGIRVALEDARGDDRSDDHRSINDRSGDDARSAFAPLHGVAEHRAASQAQAAPGAAQRFYVDRDGFAMGDGRPVAMEDLPAGVTLWDERIGIECGDAAAILWRDIGSTRRGLPPSVTLRTVFDES